MTTETHSTTVIVTPQSEWDMRGPHGVQRVKVKAVTPTHIQYIGLDDRKHSKPIMEFMRICTPAPSTVRSQAPRKILRKTVSPVPASPVTADPPPAVSGQVTPDAGVFITGTVEDTTAPESQDDATQDLLTPGSDVRKTPALGEAVARDWNGGNGLGWRTLLAKYHVSGTRLKQLLIPYGYVSPRDADGRQQARAQKARQILDSPPTMLVTAPVIHRESAPIESEVVTVTPAMSAEWLERKGGESSANRPVNDMHVRNLAESMRRGEWRVTGEAIKLDANGCVRDGQHRLWACIESGTPFRTLVVINVPDDAFDVMDTGRVRTAADVLSIHGEDNAKIVAPAARLALTWQMYGEPALAGHRPITSPQVVEFIHDHPEFKTACVVGNRIVRSGIPGGSSVWSCVVWKLGMINAHDCEAFVQALMTGANLGPGHPMLALRNRVIGSRTRMNTVEVAAVAVKAWNVWRRGGKIQVLVYRQDERFPIPE